MKAKLYVGNLPYSIENGQLEHLFGECGTVQSVNIVMDKVTGRARGFGFVEMKNQQEADLAVKNLNNFEFQGRNLRVNIASNDERPSTFRNRY